MIPFLRWSFKELITLYSNAHLWWSFFHNLWDLSSMSIISKLSFQYYSHSLTALYQDFSGTITSVTRLQRGSTWTSTAQPGLQQPFDSAYGPLTVLQWSFNGAPMILQTSFNGDKLHYTDSLTYKFDNFVLSYSFEAFFFFYFTQFLRYIQ